jgi:hypothetical protein
MAVSLATAIRLMDASTGPWMNPDAAKEVARHGKLFLRVYHFLAVQAQSQGRCAYKLRPKLHYMWHMFDSVERTGENPRRQDLFDAEDFIGKIKKVANSTHVRNAPLRTIQRYLLFVKHRWRKRR